METSGSRSEGSSPRRILQEASATDLQMKANKAIFGSPKQASNTKNPVILSDFNHLNIYWKNKQ